MGTRPSKKALTALNGLYEPLRSPMHMHPCHCDDCVKVRTDARDDIDREIYEIIIKQTRDALLLKRNTI
ncbi:MAG: hypothetical protein QQN63_00040 [Nitrosopumilus sp.]